MISIKQLFPPVVPYRNFDHGKTSSRTTEDEAGNEIRDIDIIAIAQSYDRFFILFFSLAFGGRPQTSQIALSRRPAAFEDRRARIGKQ